MPPASPPAAAFRRPVSPSRKIQPVDAVRNKAAAAPARGTLAAEAPAQRGCSHHAQRNRRSSCRPAAGPEPARLPHRGAGVQHRQRRHAQLQGARLRLRGGLERRDRRARADGACAHLGRGIWAALPGAAPGAALQYRVPVQPSIDGNTVEMDTELAQFSDNALRMQADLTFMSARLRELQTAIQDSKSRHEARGARHEARDRHETSTEDEQRADREPLASRLESRASRLRLMPRA